MKENEPDDLEEDLVDIYSDIEYIKKSINNKGTKFQSCYKRRQLWEGIAPFIC